MKTVARLQRATDRGRAALAPPAGEEHDRREAFERSAESKRMPMDFKAEFGHLIGERHAHILPQERDLGEWDGSDSSLSSRARLIARPLIHAMICAMQARWVLVVAIGALAAALLACANTLPLAPTQPPSPTRVTVGVAPTATGAPADTGWQAAVSGLELRRLRVGGDGGATVTLVRLRPEDVRFRVLYTPGQPKRVAEWARQAAGGAAKAPLLIFNASFFTDQGRATALVVSDGQRHEHSYRGFGGMFAVAGERVWIQSLREQPYDPAQPLDQAVQAFPVLVRPGGVVNAQVEDGAVSPRTAIAIDRSGRVLVIVCPSPFFSLRDLASFLADSDLDIDAALNLDGGISTGLWLSAGETRIELDSFVPVPSVIAVEAR